MRELPICHIKEAILLWRGTLKDFIRRNSLQPPPSAHKVSWDQRVLQPRSFAQLSDQCPHQSLVPLHWAAPWGVSGWLSRCLWTSSSLCGTTFISILSLFSPAHFLVEKALPQLSRRLPQPGTRIRHSVVQPCSVQSNSSITNFIQRWPLYRLCRAHRIALT